MRQVYVDNFQPGNEVYKISFYTPSQGYLAFRDWIGYTADTGHTFTKKLITGGNVSLNGFSINTIVGFLIKGVKAFDQNSLLVYGNYGFVPTILYSSNGGDSYSVVYYSQFNNLQLSTGVTDIIFPIGAGLLTCCPNVTTAAIIIHSKNTRSNNPLSFVI